MLIPVLDDDKHYWVGDAEVEKLLRHGEGWLREHPERELITNRYLKHQKRLAREALSRLIGEEEPEADELAETHAREEESIEKPISLGSNGWVPLWPRYEVAEQNAFSIWGAVKADFCANF